MNEKGNEEFVWRTHSYINDYVRLGDGKAGALFAVFGALTGVIMVTFWADSEEALSWWRALVFALALALNSVVLILSIDVVRPRTNRSLSGLVFWEHIGDRSLEEYRETLRTLDQEGLFDAITAHVLEISAIANAKYARLKQAFWVSYPAFGASIAALALL